MKRLFITALAVTFLACKEASKDDLNLVNYTVISGQILNTTDDAIRVYGTDFKHEIEIQEDGKFNDTIDISNGYYSFSIGRERSNMYLSPGANLSLTLDVEQFDETIKYAGEGAVENNFLAQKAIMYETMNGKMEELYTLAPEAFDQKTSQTKEAVTKALESLKEVDANFVEGQKEDINYSYLNGLMNYPGYHEYFAKPENLPELPENFKSFIGTLDYDNAIAFDASRSYRNLVNQKLSEIIYSGSNDKSERTQTAIDFIKAKKNQKIKDGLVQTLAYEVSPGNETAELVYNAISEISTNDKFKTELTEKFEKIKNLVEGKPSPRFAYENYKGGETSLADLKGKFVYVDVWATWCGPCKAEIPSLKKVEKAYHNKNIEFVSISIDQDKDKETWRKMIEEKDLQGIQLFAEAAWKSQFAVDYAIEGIPRFILIDPEGNIVTANAPRPSDPKLIELFNSHKI